MLRFLQLQLLLAALRARGCEAVPRAAHAHAHGHHHAAPLGDEAGPPLGADAKCPKCPAAHAHAHEPAHPPPADDDMRALLGKGPPPITRYGAEAPTGGVDIASNQLLRERMETNIDYLLTAFDVEHLLAPFRQRAGNASASWGARAPVGFWDTDLLGSNAGRFLMGAGNTLRWIEHAALRQMMARPAQTPRPALCGVHSYHGTGKSRVTLSLR